MTEEKNPSDQSSPWPDDSQELKRIIEFHQSVFRHLDSYSEAFHEAQASLGHLVQELMRSDSPNGIERLFSILRHRSEKMPPGNALRSFMELCRMDHLIYKFDVYKVLMGLSKQHPSHFASHLNCRLGKWHHNWKGSAKLSKLKGLDELEAPHRAMHDHAIHAVSSYYAKDYDKTIQSMDAMEQASHRLMVLLETIASSAEEGNVEIPD